MASKSSLPVDAGTGPADLVLVQRALRGDGQAVDEVLARLSCCVRFVARLNRNLGCGLAAEGLEDVVQQVYAAMWPRLADYAGTAALETWAYGFCRNCLRAEVRRRLRRSRGSLDGAVGEDILQRQASTLTAPHELAECSEGLDRLHEEMDRLDPLDREILFLRHLQEWSFERISAAKGMAPSTIKDRCYRAFERIRFRMTRLDRE